jgi:hypothetical protein
MEEKIIIDLSANHDSLQIEASINLEKENEVMKENLKKLYVQRIKWKLGHNRNATCWPFYCVNDNKKVDVKFLQIMKYILCYINPMLVSNIKTQAKKNLILYNTTNGIIALKKMCF